MFLILRSDVLNTGQFRKKVALPHVYNEVTGEPTMATPQLKAFWIQNAFCCGVDFETQSPLAAAARNTFPRQLQTNFESFPNNCCISRDCRLTGYFITNMSKC
jgi:hypothetical protein